MPSSTGTFLLRQNKSGRTTIIRHPTNDPSASRVVLPNHVMLYHTSYCLPFFTKSFSTAHKFFAKTFYTGEGPW